MLASSSQLYPALDKAVGGQQRKDVAVIGLRQIPTLLLLCRIIFRIVVDALV